MVPIEFIQALTTRIIDEYFSTKYPSNKKLLCRKGAHDKKKRKEEPFWIQKKKVLNRLLNWGLKILECVP